jgi:hypothetical protein
MVVAGIFALVVLLSYVVAEDAQAIGGCGFSLSTPLCLVGKAGGSVVGSLASDAITSLAQAVMKWVVSSLQEMATVWVGITPPALTDSSGQATGTVAWLASNLMPLTVVLAMVSIFVGSIKIAIEERPAAHLRQLVKYLFTFVLVSGSAAAFVGMSIAASDDLATWMIHNAIGQETFAHKIGTLLGVTLQGAPPVGFAATAAVAFATIVLGILACLAMIGQVMIMLLRGAMLIALVGTLPAAAAASNTEVGMMWFKKQIAWVIAWAAYPLAAAVIYSAAFLLPGQGGLDALLSGVLLLIAAVVALPVLIRFLVPMTSAVSGGSGVGQIAAEGAAAAMLMRGLPTGAAQVNEDDSASSQTGGGEGSAGGGEGSSGTPSGAAAVGGDDSPAGGSAAANGSGGAGAGAAEGAGSSAGGAGAGGGAAAGAGAGGGAAAGGGAGGATAGAGVAVQMGMDATRSVGESAAEGADDGSPGGGGGPSGGSGGANGSGNATYANGSYAGEGPVGDGGAATGAAASGGSGDFASDGASGGGPAGAGPAAGGAGGGGYAAGGPAGSDEPRDGGSGGMSEGPSGTGGTAGPSGA